MLMGGQVFKAGVAFVKPFIEEYMVKSMNTLDIPVENYKIVLTNNLWIKLPQIFTAASKGMKI